jgi:hypothetical protein
MPRSTPRPTATAAAALALLLTGALAACGDDDADGGTGTTAPPSEEAAFDAAACDAFAGVTAGFAGDPAVAGEAAADLVAAVPDDLADHATAIADAFAAMESDPEALGAPEFVAGWQAVGDAAFDGCETEEAVDVRGVDFAFTGLPAELPAGRVALRLTNESESGDPHELVLVRRLPGTDAPVEDLLALPPDQLFSQVAMTAVLFVEEPDGSAAGLVDLEAGDYVAVCMLPTNGDETSPHAEHGMTFEIEVS